MPASTEDGLRVRSRRGLNMTHRLPALAELPGDIVLDGEIVAFNKDGLPHWPLVCQRLLHGDRSIALTYVLFDVLRVDGHDLTCNASRSERARWRAAHWHLAMLLVEPISSSAWVMTADCGLLVRSLAPGYNRPCREREAARRRLEVS